MRDKANDNSDSANAEDTKQVDRAGTVHAGIVSE